MPARNISSSKASLTDSTAAERDSQTLKLPDGRVLGFAEYGSPTEADLLLPRVSVFATRGELFDIPSSIPPCKNPVRSSQGC